MFSFISSSYFINLEQPLFGWATEYITGKEESNKLCKEEKAEIDYLIYS